MSNDWFFEKFALIADAPGAVERMRELVLDLATEGRIVSQLSSEGNGQTLLTEIRNNTQATDAEILLDRDLADAVRIPSSWSICALGEVAEIVRGVSFPGNVKTENPRDGYVACLRTASIQAEIDWQDVIYIPQTHVSRSDQWVLPNDIMISMANSYELVGKVAVVRSVPQKATFGAFLAAIRPILLDPYYLLYVLRSPRMQVAFRASSSQTTNIANISLGRMRPIPFPLPPLAEQKRIVAKVDELMGMCDELEAQQQERELRKSVLIRSSLSRFAESPTRENLGYLFHNSYDIPPSELRKSILSLAVQGKLVPQDPEDEPAEVLLQRLRSEKLENIRTGKMRKLRSNEDSFVPDPDVPLPPGWALGCIADFGAPEDNAVVDGPFGSNLKLSDYDQNGAYPVITISNIDNGFDLATLRKVTEEKFQELKRSAVRANDILVAKIGSSYGKVGRYPDYMPVGIIPANLLKITPHPSMDWRFLIKALQSPDFKAELEQIVQFTAQPAFGVSRFKLLPIAVPPLAEQHRIVAKVDQLMALVDKLERQQAASREKASNLLDAIVHEMTSGG